MSEWIQRNYRVEVRYPSGYHVPFSFKCRHDALAGIRHLLKINKSRKEPFSISLFVEEASDIEEGKADATT